MQISSCIFSPKEEEADESLSTDGTDAAEPAEEKPKPKNWFLLEAKKRKRKTKTFYQCDLCPKRFVDKQQHKNHKASVHAGTWFLCGIIAIFFLMFTLLAPPSTIVLLSPSPSVSPQYPFASSSFYFCLSTSYPLYTVL